MPPTKPWGTIPKCRLKLGHQKLTEFELEQSVERLRKVRPRKIRQWWPDDHKHKRSEELAITKTVDRLCKNSSVNVVDSDRVPKGRIRNMGIVNSFAWKGYN
ncbi:uncharacterized protein LOC120334356 [Styela clava]|uniref:uncharacterized protein LOC120334356 n=1 Tax=Styela clava TaxID=7725 RepID=UPI001939F168|nr:uncharacterized protein LOC120334356 [Styela clava]